MSLESVSFRIIQGKFNTITLTHTRIRRRQAEKISSLFIKTRGSAFTIGKALIKRGDSFILFHLFNIFHPGHKVCFTYFYMKTQYPSAIVKSL